MDFLVHHLLQTSAKTYPKKEALVQGDKRLNYSEVYQSCQNLASGLQQVGCRRLDRIGIYLDHSIEQAISIFAVSQAGGVFVPINSLLFPNQVNHIAQDCQMRGLITTPNKLASITGHLVANPFLEFIIIVGEMDYNKATMPTYSFEKLIRTPASILEEVSIGPDLAALIYTSGSTGKPKGVMLDHSQIMAGTSIVSQYLRIQSTDRILAILPFSFDAGLNQLMTAFEKGSTLIIKTFIFAREIVQELLKEKITALAGVPTLWSFASSASLLNEQAHIP